MIEQGVVEKTDGNYAVVHIYKNGSCDGCNLCDNTSPQEEKKLWVYNRVSARNGDWVEVQISAKTVIATAVIIFILPVLAIIIGYILGEQLRLFLNKESQFINALGAVFSLALSLAYIKRRDKKSGSNESGMPFISRVIYPSKGIN